MLRNLINEYTLDQIFRYLFINPSEEDEKRVLEIRAHRCLSTIFRDIHYMYMYTLQSPITFLQEYYMPVTFLLSRFLERPSIVQFVHDFSYFLRLSARTRL